MQTDHEYPVHLIIGDNTFSRIKTGVIYKGEAGEPVVEGTTFGRIIHGGDLANDDCMYRRDVSDYQMLYSLDVLGVEDRGEDNQLDVYNEFNETIVLDKDQETLAFGREETLSGPSLRTEYRNIVAEQLKK